MSIMIKVDVIVDKLLVSRTYHDADFDYATMTSFENQPILDSKSGILLLDYYIHTNVRKAGIMDIHDDNQIQEMPKPEDRGRLLRKLNT